MFFGQELEQSSTTVPAFVTKLWKIVNAPEYDELICWCENGSSFVIKDQSRLSTELLPMYYKHNNLASFVRQLNKYGFRKVASVNSASLKGDVSDDEFFHPHFIKGCPTLLEQIKRKVTTSKYIPEIKTDNSLLGKLIGEVHQMQQKQSVFESRITAMKAENDALWREHSLLRQKHQKQQKIVNRLIQFLLSLVHQTRNANVKRRNMPLMLKDGTCLTIDELTSSNIHGSTSPIICEIDPSQVSLSQNTSVANILTSESNVPVICIPEDQECVSALLENSNNTEATGNKIEDPFNLNIKVSAKSNTNSSKKKLLKNPGKRKLKPLKVADIVDNIDVDKLVQDEATRTVQSEIRDADIFINNLNYKHDETDNVLSSDPLIFSPSGTQILSPEHVEETEENTTTSLVLSDPSAPVSKEDVENHIDLIQSDLDALKEILHGEGLSLDVSTIMGLFGGEDLISMNMPDVGRNNGKTSPVGKELVSYGNPSFMDISDCLDDDDDLPIDDTSLIDEISSTLNTPHQEPLTIDYPNHSPPKRLKSNFN